MSEGEQEAFRMIPQDVRKKARKPLSAAAKAIKAHNDAYYASLTEEEKRILMLQRQKWRNSGRPRRQRRLLLLSQ